MEAEAIEGFSVLRGRSLPFHQFCRLCGLPRPGYPDIPLVQLCEHPRGLVGFLLGVVPFHQKTLPRRHLPPRHDSRNLTMLPDSHVIRGRFCGNSRLVSHEFTVVTVNGVDVYFYRLSG